MDEMIEKEHLMGAIRPRGYTEIWYRRRAPRIDLAEASKVVKERKEIQGGVPGPVMLHLPWPWFFSARAFKYLMGKAGTEGINRVAMMVKGQPALLAYQVLAKFKKKTFPAEFFNVNDIAEAEAFLMEGPDEFPSV
jgi:hypothetical protein